MKKIVLIAAVTGLVGIAALAVGFSNKDRDQSAARTAQTMAGTSADPAQTDAPGTPDAPAAETAAPAAATAGYVDYVSLDRTAADRPTRVLFFKADWCYTCSGLHKDIEANSAAVPADVQIIRVDYDKETALKQKYDIRQQHTLVQIDGSGNVVKKWVLSSTLEDLSKQIERS